MSKVVPLGVYFVDGRVQRPYRWSDRGLAYELGPRAYRELVLSRRDRDERLRRIVALERSLEES